MTLQEVVDHFRAEGFSGAAGVFSPKSALAAAAGAERGRPLTPGDHVLIGSVTKQFTAAAILKLSELGKLRVDDPVAKYVSGFKHPKITIHHLLVHTSGIRDMTDHPEFIRLKATKFVSLEPLVKLIETLPIDFRPGKKWDYSNSNYILLSHVIEVASGTDWWTFVKRELTDPAGMKETNFLPVRGPDIVSGHTVDGGDKLVPIDEVAYLERGWAHGAGGMESTVRDMALWNEALYGGKILNAKSIRSMTKAHADTREGTHYGYGIFIARDRESGVISYFHPGGIPGFIAHNAYYPKQKLSTIVLGNVEAPEQVSGYAKALSEVELKGETDL